jgi:hypothetical protein
MRSLPIPVPVQRSSSYGGSFVGSGTAAVPRSAKRWARSAHLHEVRRARHQHHHHHHHNHNQGVNVSADLTGSGESESESGDVFVAAPSRVSQMQSAPVAGHFGTGDDASLVRMWTRTKTRTRTQLGEWGEGEGGAGTDTWVDTDTDADADADDDSAYGLWPGPGEVDAD